MDKSYKVLAPTIIILMLIICVATIYAHTHSPDHLHEELSPKERAETLSLTLIPILTLTALFLPLVVFSYQQKTANENSRATWLTFYSQKAELLFTKIDLLILKPPQYSPFSKSKNRKRVYVNENVKILMEGLKHNLICLKQYLTPKDSENYIYYYKQAMSLACSAYQLGYIDVNEKQQFESAIKCSEKETFLIFSKKFFSMKKSSVIGKLSQMKHKLQNKTLITPKNIIVATTVFLSAAIFCTLYAYFHKYHGAFGSHQRYAEFGSYIGGVLSSIFGFATVCLLLLTMFVQRQEFIGTISMQRHETLKNELKEAFETQYEKTYEILDLPVYQVNSFPDKLSLLIFCKTYNLLNVSKSEPDKQTELKELMNKISGDTLEYKLHNADCRKAIEDLISLTRMFTDELSDISVKNFYIGRVKDTLEYAYTAGLYDQAAYQYHLQVLNQGINE